jgi:signal transduction histidine kinase
MNYEDVNIMQVTKEVNNLLAVQLRLKEKVHLICNVNSDVPPSITSDYQRLKQILINLMRNSTKFTFSGYIMLKVYLSRFGYRRGNALIGVQEAVSFEIYDTGIGVSVENQQSLFKLFGKVLQKNKSINKEGIGLGLFITKNLAIQLGGTIEFASEEGSYTKFVVTLPIMH